MYIAKAILLNFEKKLFFKIMLIKPFWKAKINNKIYNNKFFRIISPKKKLLKLKKTPPSVRIIQMPIISDVFQKREE